MATLSDLRLRIYRLLGDPTGESLDADTVIDGIQAAHDALLASNPKLAVTSITGDGSLVTFSLPVDFYQVDAVVVNTTGETLPRGIFAPGQYHGDRIAATNDWILYPNSSIAFSKPLATGEIYDLYYSAYWNKPVSTSPDAYVLEPPNHLLTALSFYAAAYSLIKDAISAADIGQYRTKVDSGTPEHNPVKDTVTYLMNLFNIEVSRHPKHTRTMT